MIAPTGLSDPRITNSNAEHFTLNQSQHHVPLDSNKMTPSDTKSNRIDRETPNGTHTIHPESNDDEAGAKSRAETALPPLPAAARALSPPSRKREVSSEEERTEARRAANRKSALESRKRRKVLIG